jgi:plastocyanin
VEPDNTQENQTNETAHPSYNKRPAWQWLVIYAVIGIIVYGLIYFLFLSKKQKPYSINTPAQNTATVTQGAQTSLPSITTTPQTGQKVSEAKVSLTKSGFSPQTVTVKSGTKVVWTNESGATATVNSSPHPAHTDYPLLNLGQFDEGETLSLAFDKPGTYKYHNHLNTSQFGTIIVE